MPARQHVAPAMSPGEASDSSLSSVPSVSCATEDLNGTLRVIQPTSPSRKRKAAVPAVFTEIKKRLKIENGLSQSGTSRESARQNRIIKKVTTESEITGHIDSNPGTTVKEEETETLILSATKSPSRKKAKVDTAVLAEKVGGKEGKEIASSTPKISRKQKTTTSVQAGEEKAGGDLGESPKKPRRRNTATVIQKNTKQEETEETPKKVKRPRKTKEEKEAEAMPLAVRTTGLRMFVGAHVSGAKGIQNAITNCVHIGGNAFALFLKSQRKWENPPLQDENRSQFVGFCGEHKYDAASHILPHGSYLVNLAQENPDKAKQAYDAFLDDLQRCEALEIKLYNFHPGNTGPAARSSAISRIAIALNRAHAATKTVKPLLENMASHGNTIGGTFEDLRDIINEVEDKSRIGVCIDTCHSFVAGYDLRTPEAFRSTLNKFDEVVGMKYLSALHLNDSKAPFASHRDLHQNIGLGFLGLRAFHNVMNESKFEGLPMVLETPIDSTDNEGKLVEDRSIWAKEIKLLESLIGMNAEGAEFKELEADLAAKGAEERQKYREAHERKLEKDKKAAEKGTGKGKGRKEKKDASENDDNSGEDA